jgi:hypothetical protein
VRLLEYLLSLKEKREGEGSVVEENDFRKKVIATSMKVCLP